MFLHIILHLIFLWSHLQEHFSSVQIPKKGKIYSVNEGNAKNWDTPTAKYASNYVTWSSHISVLVSSLDFIGYQVCRKMQVSYRWLPCKISEIHWKVNKNFICVIDYRQTHWYADDYNNITANIDAITMFLTYLNHCWNTK